MDSCTYQLALPFSEMPLYLLPCELFYLQSSTCLIVEFRHTSSSFVDGSLIALYISLRYLTISGEYIYSSSLKLLGKLIYLLINAYVSYYICSINDKYCSFSFNNALYYY